MFNPRQRQNVSIFIADMNLFFVAGNLPEMRIRLRKKKNVN